MLRCFRIASISKISPGAFPAYNAGIWIICVRYKPFFEPVCLYTLTEVREEANGLFYKHPVKRKCALQPGI